jgi:transposase
VDLYLKVRLACSEGMSQREAAKHFNLSRDTVRKMLSFSVPPGYRRQAEIKRPKLDGFTGIIDSIKEADRSMPLKQRHTAKRIFDRLRTEFGFTGGYTIVKEYVRDHERRHREMFVPLAHPPGHAQADFGEALVIIGGVEQKAYFFAFDLPHIFTSKVAFVLEPFSRGEQVRIDYSCAYCRPDLAHNRQSRAQIYQPEKR